MKIDCIIVDDEPKALELLEKYIAKVPLLCLKKKCFDAFEALEHVRAQPVNLIFLDVSLPELSGMELAGMLAASQPIVFTTAYPEHALQGYEYNAIDYLLKPFSFNRFVQAVNKVAALFSANADNSHPMPPRNLFVKSGREFINIRLDDILFFESMKEYVGIYTLSGRHLVYKRMKVLEQSLPEQFLRIHHSYIVNVCRIQRIANGLVVIGKHEIPISGGYKDKVQEHIARNFLF